VVAHGAFDQTLRLDGGRFTDTAGIERVAGARNLPLSVVDIDDENTRDIYGCDLVLIRPDGHIAWRGSVIGEDHASLLDSVAGGSCIRIS